MYVAQDDRQEEATTFLSVSSREPARGQAVSAERAAAI